MFEGPKIQNVLNDAEMLSSDLIKSLDSKLSDFKDTFFNFWSRAGFFGPKSWFSKRNGSGMKFFRDPIAGNFWTCMSKYPENGNRKIPEYLEIFGISRDFCFCHKWERAHSSHYLDLIHCISAWGLNITSSSKPDFPENLRFFGIP